MDRSTPESVASFRPRRGHRRWLASIVVLGALLFARGARAGGLPELPPGLPRYDVEMNVDVDHHVVDVVQRVTWTNRHPCPTRELVFNAHSCYEVPDDQVGFLAKMLEIMRMKPSEALTLDGPACKIDKVTLLEPDPNGIAPANYQEELPRPRRLSDGQRDEPLPPPRPVPWVARPVDFHFQKDNQTALVVPLPREVGPGEKVTVEIAFTLTLPPKQGRWGQWKGVTFLSNWLPVLAYYDEHGWQPTPFVPWHQPWFNEAGQYNVRATLPKGQKVASTGSVVACRDLGDGWQQLDITVCAARDFAFLCSSRWKEYSEPCGPVLLKVMAFPEHEFYARDILRIMSEAIPVYSKWFGPFPYPEFTIAESYFGWNGNECGDLVMIDERVFDMPHFAESYVDYLVSHEICHQWWYNIIGTNGYCETFMDEAPAVFFSHHLQDIKNGRNNQLLNYPFYLEWLPSITRENYRYYGMYGTLARGEWGPCVQDMPKFGHVINLFSMCYDKGSKVIGMIEDRLGTAAFFDLMHIIYRKYYFRILRVKDFQHELEAFTGQSWEQFFEEWLYGKGITDWAVEKVKIEPPPGAEGKFLSCLKRGTGQPVACADGDRWRVTVLLHQKADYNQPTVVGFQKEGCEGYQVRVPVVPPIQRLEVTDPPATIEMLPNNRVRLVVELPWEPAQVAVDPDHVIPDKNPANNLWKSHWHPRIRPLYTFLDESDLTNQYDRWNVILGPWLYFAGYNDPWFTRSTMIGGRAGLYRMQSLEAGVYGAYRTDFQDVVVGGDFLVDHLPWAHTQFGGIYEQRVFAGLGGAAHPDRGALFGRYVIDYGDSLYLAPFQYAEAFGMTMQNFLPFANLVNPGGERFNSISAAGLHYHINYYTPYWDPEGGFQCDLIYAGGDTTLSDHQNYQELYGQFAFVKFLPDGLGFLSETRYAVRMFGAAALPLQGEFFTMGGPQRFRGFGLADREGSAMWVGTLEWRVPLARDLSYDIGDHVLGLRNLYMAPFCDVGDTYQAGHLLGGTACCLGCGLRADTSWFSFIERAIFSLDVAKTVTTNTGFQIWIQFEHPF